MNNIKIIKKIGQGMLANVYLCELDKNQYALKVEKIPENNIEFDLSVQEWREVDFSYCFANNYPNHFVTLCKHSVEELDDDSSDESEENYVVKKYKIKGDYCKSTKNRLKKKNKSNFYMKRLYTLVDDVLKNVIDDLSKEQLYSVTIQVAFICFVMQIHGYTHNDLHLKNIGIIWTNDEHITLIDKKIKTYGIHVKALDFGIVLHNKYFLNKDETQIHKYGLVNDINRFVIRLVKFEYIEGNDVVKIIGWNDYPDTFDEFVSSSDYYLVEDRGINPYDRFYIYQMLYPDNFQKMFLKTKYKKTNKPIFRYDLEHILYIFKHKLDLRKIMKYFYKLSEK